PGREALDSSARERPPKQRPLRRRPPLSEQAGQPPNTSGSRPPRRGLLWFQPRSKRRRCLAGEQYLSLLRSNCEKNINTVLRKCNENLRLNSCDTKPGQLS